MNRKDNVTDITAYRAARRRAGNIRWVLVLVFLVACMFAGYFFSISSFFGIRKIEVEGNRTVSYDRILELAEIHPGDNIFSVDRDRTAAWIQFEPHIRTAEVLRQLPGTVLIRVTERRAVACMMTKTALVELDATGRVLERTRVWSSLELPLISGVDYSATGCMPGVILEGAGLAEALSIIAQLPSDAEDLGEIHVGNPQDIKIYTLSGIEIRLGDCEGFPQKYLIYSNILKDNRAEGNPPLAYIDVSIPEKPTFTYRDRSFD